MGGFGYSEELLDFPYVRDEFPEASAFFIPLGVIAKSIFNDFWADDFDQHVWVIRVLEHQPIHAEAAGPLPTQVLPPGETLAYVAFNTYIAQHRPVARLEAAGRAAGDRHVAQLRARDQGAADVRQLHRVVPERLGGAGGRDVLEQGAARRGAGADEALAAPEQEALGVLEHACGHVDGAGLAAQLVDGRLDVAVLDDDGVGEGEVVAVGDGHVNDKGERVPLTVKEGDKVIFSSYAGDEISVGDNDYLLLRESDILATF